MLVVGTQATAATKQERTTDATRSTRSQSGERTPRTLEARLAAKLDAVRKHRGTVRFFEKRPRLLRSPEHGARARAQLRRAERRLARALRDAARLRQRILRREERRLRKLPPRAAICTVFGRSYCRQAVSVAWCESRLDPGAQNGQYLGLFQMGAHERALFGHGSSPHSQARAAHTYFVRSGKDWSPWSCKPGFAYY